MQNGYVLFWRSGEKNIILMSNVESRKSAHKLMLGKCFVNSEAQNRLGTGDSPECATF